MTKEDKELLLKALCEMLPHEVMCAINGHSYELVDIDIKREIVYVLRDGCYMAWSIYSDNDLKPYLRPMESMTKEEFYELCVMGVNLPPFEDYYGQMQYSSGAEGGVSDVEIEDIIEYMNYLNAHHFDYRGLIDKGLALPAKEGMYQC